VLATVMSAVTEVDSMLDDLHTQLTLLSNTVSCHSK
jgi:hypothetical protein